MVGLMGSDKLQAEESETYFRMLLESAPDAMIIVDEKGRMTIVNNQAESMFGYDRSEMLGQPIEMLLPERIRGAHVARRQAYIDDPELRYPWVPAWIFWGAARTARSSLSRSA